MSTLIVDGPARLQGTFRPTGNKNAALPIIAATLLTEEPVVLRNVPRIGDVLTLVELLDSLGAGVAWLDGNTLRIEARNLAGGSIDADIAARIRASILLLGPLLARLGEAETPPPGGDVIGRRRIDTHVLALEALGAAYTYDTSHHFKADQLVGADLFLDEPSVTATENAVMAAVTAQGDTIIGNAASEPHVQDLCRLLNAMGARIDGVGSNVLTVAGVERLHGCEYTIQADHVEVASVLALAAITRSPLVIAEAPADVMRPLDVVFDRLGFGYRRDGDSLVLSEDQDLAIKADIGGAIPKIEDGPWPQFPADLTSIALVAATQCRGTVLIHEKMFESRMFFVDKLLSMGARIVLCDPHRAVVVGPSRLLPGNLVSPDIRAGMAMLIAALAAHGTSEIHNVEQIDRGYEKIDERLRSLGAKIERV